MASTSKVWWEPFASLASPDGRRTDVNDYYITAIWIGMALIASLVSVRIAVPVALCEIVVGALGGNIPGIREHVEATSFVVFLAGAGSIVLTFLAGAEIDPASLRRHWKAA